MRYVFSIILMVILSLNCNPSPNLIGNINDVENNDFSSDDLKLGDIIKLTEDGFIIEKSIMASRTEKPSCLE